MKVFAITDIGRVRPINEDACYMPEADECFCAVADGMGGHNAGEVASALAVKVFAENMKNVSNVTATAMRAAVDQANEAVFQAAQQSDQMSGMGTTFSALAVQNETAYIAHVGDSRVYLLRRGTVMRVTMDHTLVEEMVLKGLITVKEARVHPKRNIITRALGTAAKVEVDILQMELRPGDIFFLCTDGLSNHVEERDILKIAFSHEMWQDKLKRLVGMALENGGQDNITAMFAVLEEAIDR